MNSFKAQQLQDDCDVQATNIILHGLPPDVYALVNHQEAAKDIWDRQVQVNTKFLNALLPEWSKFVTDVKYPGFILHSTYSSCKHITLQSISRHQSVSPQPFISSVSDTEQSQAEFPQLDSSLAVPTFQFPPSNNQLKRSFQSQKIRQPFKDGIFTVQQVQGKTNSGFAALEIEELLQHQGEIYEASQQRVVKCYNFQGEGHIGRQCTQLKRSRNFAWFKEKQMLVEAQEAGKKYFRLESNLCIIADPGIKTLSIAQGKTMPSKFSFPD
ncbi:hypothetical protein Tco_1375794 [Tanacetum coccineum]